MKNNKKSINTTPVFETKKNYEPGTVGEFIAILNEFPKDAKFNLNGNASISDAFMCEDGEPANVVVYPKNEYPENFDDNNLKEEYYMPNESTSDKSYEEIALDNHFNGRAYDNNEFLKSIRNTPADVLIDANIMIPNMVELGYENKLHPYQYQQLTEIRDHNSYVAECMAETYRRQIAALLEYNTQCLAHFAYETKRSMCENVGDTEF